MKHRFLTFLVAFLFCLTGCARKKKTVSKKIVTLTTQAPDAPDLISPSQDHKKLQKYYKKKLREQQRRDDVLQDPYKNEQEQIRFVEARLADIPTPLLAQAVSAQVGVKGCYTLVYGCSLSFNQVIDFYTKEMAQAGWCSGPCFAGKEWVALFTKQNSTCIVSVRSGSKKWLDTGVTMVYMYVQL